MYVCSPIRLPSHATNCWLPSSWPNNNSSTHTFGLLPMFFPIPNIFSQVSWLIQHKRPLSFLPLSIQVPFWNEKLPTRRSNRPRKPRLRLTSYHLLPACSIFSTTHNCSSTFAPSKSTSEARLLISGAHQNKPSPLTLLATHLSHPLGQARSSDSARSLVS